MEIPSGPCNLLQGLSDYENDNFTILEVKKPDRSIADSSFELCQMVRSTISFDEANSKLVTDNETFEKLYPRHGIDR